MTILDRQWQVVDGVVHERVKLVAHTFSMGDVEDVDIYVADPIYQWQQTDNGKFIMERALETPTYQTSLDHEKFGYKVAIIAVLSGADATFYTLKNQ